MVMDHPPAPIQVEQATASDNSTQIIGNIGQLSIKSGYSYLALLKGRSDYTWWKDRNEVRAPNTCKWFLKHSSYLTWLDASSGPLLVSGDPGCGKSVLARYLIDSRFEGRVPEDTSICHFFFKDGDGAQRRIDQALCALLHQLFTQQPNLEKTHLAPHAHAHGGGLVSDASLLWQIMTGAIADPAARPVVIVLDALDECLQDQDNIGRLLGNIASHFHHNCHSQGTLKVLMTTRPYRHTTLHLDSLTAHFPSIRIRGEDAGPTLESEIASVITHRVATQLEHLSPAHRALAQERLLAVPHRTYLWCALAFEHLRANAGVTIKRTPAGIRRALEQIPRTVHDAYEGILARSKDEEATRRALRIVLAAARPLKLREMQIVFDELVLDRNGGVAAGVRLEKTGRRRAVKTLDLEPDGAFKDRLRELCGLFLVVHHGRVAFLHQTAREFLSLVVDIGVPAVTPVPASVWAHSLAVADGHATLARTCLVYLDTMELSLLAYAFANTEAAEAAEAGLFYYSVEYWAHHTRESPAEAQEAIAPLVMRISRSPRSKYFSFLTDVGLSEHLDTSTTELIIALVFGLVHIAQVLLRTHQAQPTTADGNGRTPLTYAVLGGHPAAVDLLLDEDDVDINAQDRNGLTPLHEAVAAGHVEIVKLLLKDESIDVDRRDMYGQSALAYARHNDGIRRLLLDMGMRNPYRYFDTSNFTWPEGGYVPTRMGESDWSA